MTGVQCRGYIDIKYKVGLLMVFSLSHLDLIPETASKTQNKSVKHKMNTGPLFIHSPFSLDGDPGCDAFWPCLHSTGVITQLLIGKAA